MRSGAGSRLTRVPPHPLIKVRDSEALRRVRPPGAAGRKLNPMQADALRDAISETLDDWLRPYQRAWIEDQSQQKVGNWARQTGKSETISLEAVLQGLEEPETQEKCEIIVSASQAQADEVMMKARRWSTIIDEIARKTLGLSIFMNGKPPTASRIWLYNGVRVVPLPANPYSAAGYHGDVFWDEVAKTPHDDLMWDALHPIISSQGFRFRATSTPWGDTGKFYDLWHTIPNWSKHQTTIVDAVRAGVPRNLEELRSQYDAITWAQNYLCRFLGSLTSAYPRDLLKQAIEAFVELTNEWPLPQSPAPGVWPDDVYCTLGIDIGRTNDRTALVWEYEYPEGMYRMERVRALYKVPFAEQEGIIREALRTGEVHKCQIDATGIGMQLAEGMADEFPEIVTPVTFTNQQKAQMVLAMRADLERGTLVLCPDNDLISDFSAVRQQIMESSRTVRYNSERTATGHADAHWAAGLAHDAQVNRAEWQIGDDEEERKAMRTRGAKTGKSRSKLETPLPTDPFYGGMTGVPRASDITGMDGFDGDVSDLEGLSPEDLELKLMGFGLDDDDDEPPHRGPSGHKGRRAGLLKKRDKKS